MALTAAFVDAHIGSWESSLDKSYRSYRKHWPRHLFHHAPLENAIQILTDGHVRSRNDPQNGRSKDVAGAGVISNITDTHDWARLYFRPRTPTQYYIEGIRKQNECQYGSDAHAPVLVMFVLDAKKVLMHDGVHFSDRNMQRGDRQYGCTEEFFSCIPFEKVYHEGGLGGDNTIIAHRCAEVFSRTPLPLDSLLRGIWFRSEPERDTLLYKMGATSKKWASACHVSEELKVFDKNFTFVKDISLTSEGVVFELNSRSDLATVDVKINVFAVNNVQKINFHHGSHPTVGDHGKRWIYRYPIAEGSYLVRVHLESQLAYENVISLASSLF
jgi:ssDNA thymidine ADP-ribosyltransferase, DarT